MGLAYLSAEQLSEIKKHDSGILYVIDVNVCTPGSCQRCIKGVQYKLQKGCTKHYEVLFYYHYSLEC